MLGRLAELYIEEVQKPNSDRVLCLQTSMKEIADRENSKAVRRSVEMYKTAMADRLRIPVLEMDLHHDHLEKSNEATKMFMQKAVFPVVTYYNELMVLLMTLNNCLLPQLQFIAFILQILYSARIDMFEKQRIPPTNLSLNHFENVVKIRLGIL